ARDRLHHRRRLRADGPAARALGRLGLLQRFRARHDGALSRRGGQDFGGRVEPLRQHLGHRCGERARRRRGHHPAHEECGYRGARMKLADIWSAIIETGIGVCEIVVISAIGGYVLGLFQIGGLSFALTAYLVNLGAENLLLLLVICAVTNIVLGLGLPTLAVYVMLATLVAPALVKVGVPAMAAHLFILYFGIMSLI